MLPSSSCCLVLLMLPLRIQEGTRQQSRAAHPSKDPHPYPAHCAARLASSAWGLSDSILLLSRMVCLGGPQSCSRHLTFTIPYSLQHHDNPGSLSQEMETIGCWSRPGACGAQQSSALRCCCLLPRSPAQGHLGVLARGPLPGSPDLLGKQKLRVATTYDSLNGRLTLC